jgi:hypothetical protein
VNRCLYKRNAELRQARAQSSSPTPSGRDEFACPIQPDVDVDVSLNSIRPGQPDEADLLTDVASVDDLPRGVRAFQERGEAATGEEATSAA